MGKNMSTSTPGSADRADDSAPLEDALLKNKQATEDVKKAADDLAVVHAVLDSQVAKGTNVDEGDVARAVAEAGEVEKRLTDTAERLDQVNETLARKTPSRPQ